MKFNLCFLSSWRESLSLVKLLDSPLGRGLTTGPDYSKRAYFCSHYFGPGIRYQLWVSTRKYHTFIRLSVESIDCILDNNSSNYEWEEERLKLTWFLECPSSWKFNFRLHLTFSMLCREFACLFCGPTFANVLLTERRLLSNAVECEMFEHSNQTEKTSWKIQLSSFSMTWVCLSKTTFRSLLQILERFEKFFLPFRIHTRWCEMKRVVRCQKNRFCHSSWKLSSPLEWNWKGIFLDKVEVTEHFQSLFRLFVPSDICLAVDLSTWFLTQPVTHNTNKQRSNHQGTKIHFKFPSFQSTFPDSTKKSGKEEGGKNLCGDTPRQVTQWEFQIGWIGFPGNLLSLLHFTINPFSFLSLTKSFAFAERD